MVDVIGLDSRRATRLGRSLLCRATGTSFSTAPLRVLLYSMHKINKSLRKQALIPYGGRYRTRTYDLSHVKRTL